MHQRSRMIDTRDITGDIQREFTNFIYGRAQRAGSNKEPIFWYYYGCKSQWETKVDWEGEKKQIVSRRYCQSHYC